MSVFKLKPMSSVNALWGLALTSIAGFAFFLRTYFPYDNVFTGDWVRFKWFDSWYHVRLVENLVQHFPRRIDFDPYTFFPQGQEVTFAPFYDLLLGLLVWVFGAGSPSQGTTETLAAYFPAIMGALVTIPVFFIGKALFDKKVGLIAAALITIMPGQFLLRSLLGFTDHHVAETLFSSLTMLFLILAVKSSKEKGISFESLLTRDWLTVRKPLIYTLLTGVALGLYLLSWVGGALLVFIIFVFAFIQYILDHVRGKSTDYLCMIGIPSLLIALLLIAPFMGRLGFGELQIASLIIGMLAFIALSALSHLLNRRNVRPAFYPLALLLLTGIGFAAFYLTAPSVLERVIDQFNWFNPVRIQQTIGEMKPITLSMAWEEFTTNFYLALISLVVLTYYVIKEKAAEKTLLLIWSITMLAAMIGQNRFAYYFAVNVALLSAYVSWKLVYFISSKVVPVKSEYAYSLISGLVVFFLVFTPNIRMAIDLADSESRPSASWHDSLEWMRENTPDPFDNPDFYYELYEGPPYDEDYDYPDSAYGVMAWWDYGHWITTIAHRIPNANPHQRGADRAARFFTSQDEASANRILNRLGSRYVIVDTLTSLHDIDAQVGIYGHFRSMAAWIFGEEDAFFDIYYQRTTTNTLQPITLYYPEFYRSMSSRLYLFDGKEVIPNNATIVIFYEEKKDQGGVLYKEIISHRLFATYEEAESFIQRQSGYNFRIVGDRQLVSPVPLEKLEHYRLIYESQPPLELPGLTSISEIKIFEYTP